MLKRSRLTSPLQTMIYIETSSSLSTFFLSQPWPYWQYLQPSNVTSPLRLSPHCMYRWHRLNRPTWPCVAWRINRDPMLEVRMISTGVNPFNLLVCVSCLIQLQLKQLLLRLLWWSSFFGETVLVVEECLVKQFLLIVEK